LGTNVPLGGVEAEPLDAAGVDVLADGAAGVDVLADEAAVFDEEVVAAVAAPPVNMAAPSAPPVSAEATKAPVNATLRMGLNMVFSPWLCVLGVSGPTTESALHLNPSPIPAVSQLRIPHAVRPRSGMLGGGGDWIWTELEHCRR
jgi:hypothetical protein